MLVGFALALGGSLLGGIHCVGMCGGLSSLFHSTHRQTATYHLARGVSYVGLGVLSGQGGKVIANITRMPGVGILISIVLALTLCLAGARVWMGRDLHWGGMSRLLIRALNTRMRISGELSALLAGIGTALLPCGWLHGFLLAAAATRSPAAGAFVMLGHWVGTLPYLLVFSKTLHSLMPGQAIWIRRLLALTLFGLALATIVTRTSIAEFCGSRLF